MPLIISVLDALGNIAVEYLLILFVVMSLGFLLSNVMTEWEREESETTGEL